MLAIHAAPAPPRSAPESLPQGSVQSSEPSGFTRLALTGFGSGVTKRRRSDSGRPRLGHDRGRGCSDVVIIHRYTTPMRKHLWGDDNLLSPLFCPGLSRAMGMSFLLSEAHVLPPCLGFGANVAVQNSAGAAEFPLVEP